MSWRPEYPGQKKPVWVWWDRDEPEDGLTGFHTVADRDRFSRGGPGPYRRRLSEDGHTTSQTDGWDDLVQRLCDDTGIARHPRTG